MITKWNNHTAGVQFLVSWVWLQTELDNTKFCYQLINIGMFNVHELFWMFKSISKYLLLTFHMKKFQKDKIFYTLPCSRWNRTHKLWNMCVHCTVHCDSLIRSETSLSSTHILKFESLNSCITVLNVWIINRKSILKNG